jgi:large subunit ribosomal protein L24
MKIKKGDKVYMMQGKDHGKSGKILRVFTADKKVVVEGLNLVKKTMKPRKAGQKGQIIDLPISVDISNVQLVCSSCGKPTRVGFSGEGTKKQRICKKCKATV